MSQLHYAVFTDPLDAQRARVVIDRELDEDADISIRNHRLYSPDLPITGTMARYGAVLGASLLGGAVAAIIALAILASVGPLGPTLPSLGATVVALAAISALFGALAGALAFSTRLERRLRPLRRHLEHGRAVMLIESERDLRELLRGRGAIATGALA